jgi:SagB-type dehydrogenase family enzyme
VRADESKDAISLPKPQTDGGMPVMQALSLRHSGREFSPEPLPQQTLSNLLWAACGVNRENGKRTAPSARNWQEIDIYAVLPDGLYLYDAKAHALLKKSDENLSTLVGKQEYVKTAPLGLVFVADFDRMGGVSEADKNFYSATDTGFISQNVYLFCASAGLSTVVLGSVDKTALSAAMKLRPGQKIILSQPVGLPLKK